MADGIWKQLEETSQLRRDDPSTWSGEQPNGFQALTQAGAFNAMASPVVVEALDELFGRDGWTSTETWGAPLVTFPRTGQQWTIPNRQWHLDFPVRERGDKFPGVRILTFLAPVEPRGGGTVVLEGSHRLVERLVASGKTGLGHSREIRDSLAAAHPWLHALWSKSSDESSRAIYSLGTTQEVDGVEVKLEELTGAPGDVVLMHPRTFHAPAPNCGERPRLMVAHSVDRKGVNW